MDVAHILLGRPWLCDLDVTSCYKLNTYAFIYNGQTQKNPDIFLTIKKTETATTHENNHFIC